MVERTAYLDRMRLLKDEPRVKMIAGIRHGGKSFMLRRFIAELKLSGVDDGHIIHVNFENAAPGEPRTARQIESFIGEKTEGDGKYYIFFDEIQAVAGWEKTVNALLARHNFSVYVAVSDAAALLKNSARTGGQKKYAFINFKPFSFAEYKQVFAPAVERGGGLLSKAVAVRNLNGSVFKRFFRYGGFPDVCARLSGDEGEYAETASERLKNIYASILLSDAIRRAKIRDVELLEHIANIIFTNAGKENSTRKITESLRKRRYAKNLSLVRRYIKTLENSFLIKKVSCCNLLTGKLAQANAKYFTGDHGLIVAGQNGATREGIAKNILLNDLERREFAVYSGKIKNKIIDFFAKRGNRFVFLQTVADCNDETLEQKIDALRLLDNIERFSSEKRYVVFLDEDMPRKHEAACGASYFSLRDFLLLEDI